MKRTITAAEFQEKFLQDLNREVSGLVWREDGAVYPDHIYQNMLSAEAACSLAYRCAVGSLFSKDKRYSECGKKALDYAGRSLIRCNGILYWGHSVPSLCQMGRWARDAIYAAQILDDRDAFAWLDEWMTAWPYDKEHHCFVERFTAATHYPTCVNGFLTTFNMVCEGAADAWMIAQKIGNAVLRERALDTLCGFILPGQRADGLWSYHAKRDVDMGLLNDGETEYNYNLYLLSILSNFLLDDEGRSLVIEPLERSFRELYKRFHFEDGSVYTPVHWGWDHIWESTLLCCEISWRLFRWCGKAEYEAICARGLHWLQTADLGAGNLGDGISCVGLCWNTHFMTILAEGFRVSGDVAETGQILETLRMVERKLAILPPDWGHNGLYFSLHNYETLQALQRKIMRLQGQQEEIHIPHTPETRVYKLPWEYPQTGYAAEVTLSYDEQALYLRATVVCGKAFQPYTQASLYQGDGLLLDLQAEAEEPRRLSLALENEKPVIYYYNNKIPFGGDLRLYVESEPHGWYLHDSTLTCEASGDSICYEAKILWREIGIEPKDNLKLDGGISVNRYTRCGVQFNQLGRTAMENRDRSYTGKIILDGGMDQ